MMRGVSGRDWLVSELPEDPLAVLKEWLDEAVERLQPHNPTAMTLATVDELGLPDARMVICRGFDAEAGWLVFYTDRDSRKGRQLGHTPRATLVFYWDGLQRQVRIDGPVTDAPDEQSDAYFAARPVGAQLAAWASDQSRPLASRGELEERYREVRQRFGIEADDGPPGDVARPPNWGGYRVWAERIELWVGRPNRLHDRAHYERKLVRRGDGYAGEPWRATRLWP